jgi:hypothetical protein
MGQVPRTGVGCAAGDPPPSAAGRRRADHGHRLAIDYTLSRQPRSSANSTMALADDNWAWMRAVKQFCIQLYDHYSTLVSSRSRSVCRTHSNPRKAYEAKQNRHSAAKAVYRRPTFFRAASHRERERHVVMDVQIIAPQRSDPHPVRSQTRTKSEASVRGRQLSVVLMAALLFAEPVGGQWLENASPDVPRTKDGKVDLLAPTPKTSMGGIWLSGIWQAEADPQGVAEGVENTVSPRYFVDVTNGLKPGEVTLRPEAAKTFSRATDERRQERASCALRPGWSTGNKHVSISFQTHSDAAAHYHLV